MSSSRHTPSSDRRNCIKLFINQGESSRIRQAMSTPRAHARTEHIRPGYPGVLGHRGMHTLCSSPLIQCGYGKWAGIALTKRIKKVIQSSQWLTATYADGPEPKKGFKVSERTVQRHRGPRRGYATDIIDDTE